MYLNTKKKKKKKKKNKKKKKKKKIIYGEFSFEHIHVSFTNHTSEFKIV